MTDKYILSIDKDDGNGMQFHAFCRYEGSRFYMGAQDIGHFPTIESVNNWLKISYIHTVSKPDGKDSKNFQCEVKPMKLDYGEYYPRIHRPYLTGSSLHMYFRNLTPIDMPKEQYDPGMGSEPYPIDIRSYSRTLTQLVAMCDVLSGIFRYVEPENENLTSYSHEIRNLLIVACTEVECQWKAVLKANNYRSNKNHGSFRTKDYVKLNKPLKLDEYWISFTLYPGIPSVNPFKIWNSSEPTKSISWYEAYNATKHDGENAFYRATLFETINAITACAIMIIAQFGKRSDWNRDIGEFFSFDKVPKWEFDEMYNRDINQGHRPKYYGF